ncbi:unnamed protein product [Aphanomyces euteiches]
MTKPLGQQKLMRRPSTSRMLSKQRNSAYKLMVHGPEYGTGEELVVNPESFPDLKLHDIVEITQPDRTHLRLVMQVRSLAPVRGKFQISILKDLAVQFQLEAFHDVTVQKIESSDATVDFIELSFKDQFMSRADIWRYKVALFGKCLFVGKVYETLGTRAQASELAVEMLLAKDQNVLCGVMGTETKLILRSRSSRIFWLVQMSPEMWDFADDGEMYFEKLVERLVRVLVAKWQEASVSHSVTVLVFSRSYYDKKQFPLDYDPTADTFAEECSRQAFGPGATNNPNVAFGHGPAMHLDGHDRYYEDFYKVLIQDYTGPDWSHLVRLLKEEFASYAEKHRWRLPEDLAPASYTVLPSGVVQWEELPRGVPARASEGNFLEAINVTLNVLDKHYMDRDLNRAGQGIVMITAGSAVFNVPKRLAQITKQRMMDTGVGMDMISLTTPPLHPVPLFIWKQPPEQQGDDEYNVPHWISVSFLDFDCTCGAAKKSLMRCHCHLMAKRDQFHPLPQCRMLDRFPIPALLVKIFTKATPTAAKHVDELLPPIILQRTADHLPVDGSKEILQEYDDDVFALVEMAPHIPLKLTAKKHSFVEKEQATDIPRKRVVSMQNLNRYSKQATGKQGSLPMSPIRQHHAMSPTFSPPEDTPVHHIRSYETFPSSIDSGPSPLLLKIQNASDFNSPHVRPPFSDIVGSPPTMNLVFRAKSAEPFQLIDHGDSKLTSNRRRWSHIFPWTPDEGQVFGPNWKSLVNPAVLPLTTDFYPKDLYQNYTQSFYSLTLLETTGRSTEQLLVEMVCQRLSSDFQLVDMKKKQTADEGLLTPLHQTTYLLSMGHRIHQLIYDEGLQTIDVKCYHKRLKTTIHDPYHYEYSLFDPTTASFHKQLQTFHEFPHPEDNWNTTDNLLCGYVDSMHDGTKCRRIRFVILPSSTSNDGGFPAKMQKLLDFLQSKVGPEDTLRVRVHPEPCLPAAYTATKISRQYVRVSCNTAARMEIDVRNEWLMLLVDCDTYSNLNFHIDVRWLACSGTVVDDFVTTLRRRTKQAGLELRRVPEFTQVHHLHIHPYLSSVLLPLKASCDHSTMHAVCLSWGFVFDGAYLADGPGIGHGLMPKRNPHKSTNSQRQQGSPEVWKERGYVQFMHRTAPVFLRVLAHGLVWIPSYSYESNTSDQVKPLFHVVCAWIEAHVEDTNQCFSDNEDNDDDEQSSQT